MVAGPWRELCSDKAWLLGMAGLRRGGGGGGRRAAESGVPLGRGVPSTVRNRGTPPTPEFQGPPSHPSASETRLLSPTLIAELFMIFNSADFCCGRASIFLRGVRRIARREWPPFLDKKVSNLQKKISRQPVVRSGIKTMSRRLLLK